MNSLLHSYLSHLELYLIRYRARKSTPTLKSSCIRPGRWPHRNCEFVPGTQAMDFCIPLLEQVEARRRGARESTFGTNRLKYSSVVGIGRTHHVASTSSLHSRGCHGMGYTGVLRVADIRWMPKLEHFKKPLALESLKTLFTIF
jgi:hypothetical protein